ncbi:MAG: phosphonate ABC transporter ATP-binding protein, partial [Myxococcales bacterium]|nr:phosphonate ABC transporter ATP-binding protein [Myxococcales bacterium]
MVRFREATKSYPDGTVALRSVSLEVPRGQFCVVLGPSGAGKSTLLRAVNGLTTLSSGAVEVDGTEVAPGTLRLVRSKVGMIHQQFGLVGRATVLDNVLAGALRDLSTPRALFKLFPESHRRKACALLDDLGLREDVLYRRASELSGGQQQRVAIARAFILDPAVVLADEPVASLDVAMSETILRLLRDMSAKRGTTVLCSLHQVDLAREFADRIVAMRDGSVVADGPPAAIDAAASLRIYSRAPPPPAAAEPQGARSVRSESSVGSGWPPAEWALRQPFGRTTIALTVLCAILLAISARATDVPRIFSYTGEWIAASLGLKAESQIGKGLGHYA